MSKARNNKQQTKFTGAGHHLAAANMTVTCAVEEARKRGMLSTRDTGTMTEAEHRQYVDLSRREFGIVDWERES